MRVADSLRRGRAVGYALGGLLIAAGLAAIPLVRAQRADLRGEVSRILAAQPTDRARLDSLDASVLETRATVRLETVRAASRAERKLQLVIAVDSGTLALMRDGITLRTMSARFTGIPARGTQTIARIAARPVESVSAVVDSLGRRIVSAPADSTVERVTLSDGTILEPGDASSVLLGGMTAAPGPRTILLSRRDFAAIRPNLVKGMKAVLF